MERVGIGYRVGSFNFYYRFVEIISMFFVNDNTFIIFRYVGKIQTENPGYFIRYAIYSIFGMKQILFQIGKFPLVKFVKQKCRFFNSFLFCEMCFFVRKYSENFSPFHAISNKTSMRFHCRSRNKAFRYNPETKLNRNMIKIFNPTTF